MATDRPEGASPEAVVFAATGFGREFVVAVGWVVLAPFFGHEWPLPVKVAVVAAYGLIGVDRVRVRRATRLAIDDRHLWYRSREWGPPIVLDEVISVTWRDRYLGPEVDLRARVPDGRVRRLTVPVHAFDRDAVRDELARRLAGRPRIQMDPNTRRRFAVPVPD